MGFEEAVLSALYMLANWNILFYIVLGMTIGIVLGSMPGVSGIIALGVMLVPSYYMPPIIAVTFLTSIHTGSIYGGGITAILLNIPGAPGAVATVFDGYPMTQKGLYNEALGLGLLSSAIGCFFGYFIVFLFFVPVTQLVLRFGPSEMLMVIIFAVTIVGVARGSINKSIIIGFFGLLLATVGASPYGRMRGTFGIYQLYEGIPLVPAILGLLAVSELFRMIDQEYIVSKKGIESKRDLRKIFLGMKLYFKNPLLIFRSGIIGTLVGLMPAAGSTVGSMVGYGMAKRSSKHPEMFGKGAPEGIASAETANNASEGGAMAIMMAFGIPGGAGSAVLMSAFMLHGLNPGPYLVRNNLDFAYAVIFVNLIQALMLLLIGLIFIYYFSNIIFVPTKILVPSIIVFAVLGTLGIRGFIEDTFILIICGLLGYGCKKLDYPILSLVLGFMLGGMMEGDFVRTLIIFEGRYLDILSRPIVLILFIITLLSIIIPHLKKIISRSSVV